MVTVPSSNVATVMLANYVTDNNQGLFIQMMNDKAKELGMENTFFNNCSGAYASSFDGLYQPQGFDSNAGNTTTARDLAIMTYHLIKEYPVILEFTNQPEVTTMIGTPYEESFHGYNHSVEGAEYGMEGVDGLKTGSSPSSAYNYIATAKQGDLRLIEVILGVSEWDDDNGEFYRHPIGNALLKKYFSEYEYKKILPAGKQKIDGKNVTLKSDLYGVVKKEADPQLELTDNKVMVREQLPQAAGDLPEMSVAYQAEAKKSEKKAKTAPTEKDEQSFLEKLFSLFG